MVGTIILPGNVTEAMRPYSLDSAIDITNNGVQSRLILQMMAAGDVNAKTGQLLIAGSDVHVHQEAGMRANQEDIATLYDARPWRCEYLGIAPVLVNGEPRVRLRDMNDRRFELTIATSPENVRAHIERGRLIDIVLSCTAPRSESGLTLQVSIHPGMDGRVYKLQKP